MILSQGMGGKSGPSDPPSPTEKSLILSWAVKLVQWLRRAKIVPGFGLIGSQTPTGYILGLTHPPVPVGCIMPTMADIFDVNGQSVGPDITTTLLRQGWLLLDGSTYNTAEYSDLARSLGKDLSVSTFVLPDMRGRVPMGWDNRSPLVSHSDSYDVGNVGGYRRHGLTENNHHDHSFTIDLAHDHPITLSSAEVCLTTPSGGVCGVGSPTNVVIPTGSGADTGAADFPATNDATDPNDDSTIGRTGTGNVKVSLLLPHRGDDGDGTITTPGDGNVLDDVDNRPPFLVVNWIIKAR